MSRRRLFVILIAVLLPAIVATVAYSATSSPGKSGSAPGKQKAGQQSTENEAEDQGVPGGSVTRFHGNTDVGCQLPEGADALQGNWTHGMYVDAWAATTKDATKIVAAAHSPCGKPTQAAFHGHFGAGNLPPGLAKKSQNQPTP